MSLPISGPLQGWGQALRGRIAEQIYLWITDEVVFRIRVGQALGGKIAEQPLDLCFELLRFVQPLRFKTLIPNINRSTSLGV